VKERKYMKKLFSLIIIALFSIILISCNERETTENLVWMIESQENYVETEILQDLVTYSEANDLTVEFFDVGSRIVYFVDDYKVFVYSKVDTESTEIEFNQEAFIVEYDEFYETVFAYSRTNYSVINNTYFLIGTEELDEEDAIRCVSMVDSNYYVVEVYNTSDQLALAYTGAYFTEIDHSTIYDFDQEVIFTGNYLHYKHEIFYKPIEIEFYGDREQNYYQFIPGGMLSLETKEGAIAKDILYFNDFVLVERYEIVLDLGYNFYPIYDVYVRNGDSILEYRDTIGGEGYTIDALNADILRIYHNDCDFYDGDFEIVRTYEHDYFPGYQIFPLDEDFYIKSINDTFEVQILNYSNRVIDSVILPHSNGFVWNNITLTPAGYVLDCGDTSLLWNGEELILMEEYLNDSMNLVYFYEKTADEVFIHSYINGILVDIVDPILSEYLLDTDKDYQIHMFSSDIYSVIWDRTSLEYDYIYCYDEDGLLTSGELIARFNDFYLIKTDSGNYVFSTNLIYSFNATYLTN